MTCPWNGETLGQLYPSRQEELAEAIGHASRAFVEWSATPIKDRVQPLFRFKTLVEAHMGELAELVSRENGKTIPEASAGIQRGLEVVEFACALPNLAAAEILEVSSGVDCYMRRLPLGIVAGVTPFNFPAMVPMWMFPIAIVCGNCFILKPSEQVPLTPLRLGDLLRDAGLPDGVFQVLQGDRQTVEALLDHPEIQALGFVGSTAAARAVHQRGTLAGKRVLALGGAKNHLVLLPDAEPAVTAKNVVASAVGCAGQRCMAASVLIAVGDSGHLVEAIQAEMASVAPGRDLGPVISAPAKERILSYIDSAEREGARILLDGRRASVVGQENGHWLGPTLIDQLSPASACAREEIFGPVLSVLRVDSLEEAIAIENASSYGNAASIYTTSAAAARYFEQRAQAGMVGVNIGVPVPREPFSFGGWNESKFGIGDITGRDAIDFWTKKRKVTVKWSARQSNWMS